MGAVSDLVRISRASADDLKNFLDLFQQYRSFYGARPDGQKALAFINDRLSRQDSYVAIAKINHKAVGFIQCYPAFSSVSMQPIWILNDLFVDPAYRHQGVARNLMNWIEIQAFSEHIYSIKLATQVSNQAAQRLYRSLDYKENSEFKNFAKTLVKK